MPNMAKCSRKSTAWAEAAAGRVTTCRGSTGASARRSRATSAVSSTTPIPAQANVAGAAQPISVARMGAAVNGFSVRWVSYI